VAIARRRLHLLLLLALSCGQCRERAPKPRPLGTLSGRVTLTRPGEAPVELSSGPVFEGDRLSTAPGSTATLVAEGGQTLILAEATNFRLSGGPGDLRAELLEGEVTARGVKLTILSAYGETSLGEGTGARVAVTRDGIVVHVLDGEIAVVDTKGNRTRATAGQELKVSLLGAEIIAPPAPVAPTPPTELQGPLQFHLLSRKGVTLVRPLGSPKFKAAPAGESALPLDTTFKLMPGALATLTADGLEVRPEAGASGVVHLAKQADGTAKTALRLEGAGAQVALGGDRPGTLALELGGQLVEVRSRSEAAFKAAPTRSGANLEVQLGTVSVSAGGREEQLGAGQTLSVGKAGMSVGRRPRPALVLSGGRRAQVFTASPIDVGLGWPAGNDGAQVQVAADAAFSQVLLRGRVSGTMVVLRSPPPGGELHWRVLGEDGAPRHEGHARFGRDKSTRGANESLDSEVADSGLTATVHFQSAVPRLIFTYPSVPEAKRYRLMVYPTSNLSRPVFDQQVTGTRCPAEPGTIPEGSYVWHAAPLDAAGNELAGGRMNKLEIVYDNSMTSLEIAEPAPGASITGATMRVAGVAPAGASLSVNGTEVPTDGKGRFSAQVPVASQSIFELSTAGGVAYWVRTLRAAR